jgi:hypothetical protein
VPSDPAPNGRPRARCRGLFLIDKLNVLAPAPLLVFACRDSRLGVTESKNLGPR